MSADNTPEEMIVTYPADLRSRHPEKGYWVRFHVPAGINGVDLDGETTLPGAVRAAEKLGFHPTHWADERGSVMLIPDSIVRKGGV